MYHIHTLRKYLQTINATLGDASHQILATSDYIKFLRNETEWNRIVSNIDFNELSRKRHMNSSLNDDFVVYSTIGHRDTITEKEIFYKSLFLPVIDFVIQEFNTRFSDEVLSLSKSVDTVLRLETNNIDCLIEKYSSLFDNDKELLYSELQIASHEKKTFDSPINRIITKDKYPHLYKLYSLCLALPVTCATCERSFSALRRVHNYMRTKLADSRLRDLSILCIEREFIKTIPIKSFIDQFISKPRKLMFH